MATKTEQLQGALTEAGIDFDESASYQTLNKIAKDNGVELGGEEPEDLDEVLSDDNDDNDDNKNNEPTTETEEHGEDKENSDTDLSDTGDDNADDNAGVDNAGDGGDDIELDEITKDLEEAEEIDDFSDVNDEPIGEENPIDLTQFSQDQLYSLKEQINALPERRKRKNDIKTVNLTLIDGKVMVGLRPAFRKLSFDPTQRRDISLETCPVLLQGEKEWRDVLLADIIHGEKVKVKIKQILPSDATEEVGEVMSEETKQMTIQEVKRVTRKYEVEMDGKLMRLSEEVINR